MILYSHNGCVLCIKYYILYISLGTLLQVSSSDTQGHRNPALLNTLEICNVVWVSVLPPSGWSCLIELFNYNDGQTMHLTIYNWSYQILGCGGLGCVPYWMKLNFLNYYILLIKIYYFKPLISNFQFLLNVMTRYVNQINVCYQPDIFTINRLD